VFKFLPTLAAGILGILIARPAEAGSIVVGGMEDSPTSNWYEGNGDYNDLMFQMMGNVSVLSPSSTIQALTPGMVNETGSLFWDNHSYDGEDYNFGYCATGLGNCSVQGVATQSFDYVAGPGGAAPTSEMFQASGALTITLLAKLTCLSSDDTLGWYDPSNPTVLHLIFAGSDAAGTTVTFTPSALFALYGTNGVGETFASMTANNQQVPSSDAPQHFALLEETTPEPGTLYLAAVALAACAAWKIFGRTVGVKRY
jgi:hypothetical protein